MADATINTNSNNYKTGYNAGVSAADSRVNVNSTNYKTGYNAGVSAADGRVNTSTASYTSGYNDGYQAGVATAINKGSLVHTDSHLEDGELSGSYTTPSKGQYLITLTASGTVCHNITVNFSNSTSKIIYDNTIGLTNGTTSGMGANRNVIVELEANVTINYYIKCNGWASQFIQIAFLE